MEIIRSSNEKYRNQMIINLDREVKGYNQICIEVYYNAGGMNYFTYKQENRGYYISFNPCRVKGICLETVPFDGLKMLIKKVGRKSVKSFENCLDELTFPAFLRFCNAYERSLTSEEITYLYKTLKGE